MIANPERLDATAALAAMRDGRLTAERLVEACAARIAAREPIVNAWMQLAVDDALAAARRLDRGDRASPLCGIPVGVKDIIDTVDLPTGYGSAIYAGHRPPWDAASVALLRRAGAIVMGKTVTTEFAYFAPGKTANPHDPRRTPGGSSSGSAAAVADAMVPVAFGTQTAASITRPASFCGAVGYKPSYGHLSLVGIKAFAGSFDTLGTLTRSVDDAALVRAALVGDPVPPALSAPAAPRIALCRTPWWSHAEPATQAIVERAAARLGTVGARVAILDLPREFAALADTHKTIMAHEAATTLAFEYDAHRERLSPQIRDLIESGRAISRARYVQALAEAEAARAALRALQAELDAILAPSAVGEAPLGLGATGDPIFSRMWTLLHVPSVSLPAFAGPAGLPVGVQVIGRLGADEALLGVARWAHRALLEAA